MHLSTLPAVLVQSIMHALQPTEIIALARSCQWTLKCADSAFVWRDAPPIEVQWKQRSPLVLSNSRLRRWIPLALVSTPVLKEIDIDALLALLDRWPRVASLEWIEWDLPMERGLQLLSHPSLRSHMRDIGLTKIPHVEWMMALAPLDCLREFNLIHDSTTELLEAVVHLRSLRFLLVSRMGWRYVPSTMQLPQLTTLCVYAPKIDAENFLEFCSVISGMEELWLQSWDQRHIRSIGSADLASGFASLRRLHRLKFDNSFDELSLAPVLQFVPALRHLHIPTFQPRHVPTLLAQLTQAAPHLEVHLNAPEDRVRLAKAQLALKTATTINSVLCAGSTELQKR